MDGPVSGPPQSDGEMSKRRFVRRMRSTSGRASASQPTWPQVPRSYPPPRNILSGLVPEQPPAEESGHWRRGRRRRASRQHSTADPAPWSGVGAGDVIRERRRRRHRDGSTEEHPVTYTQLAVPAHSTNPADLLDYEKSQMLLVLVVYLIVIVLLAVMLWGQQALPHAPKTGQAIPSGGVREARPADGVGPTGQSWGQLREPPRLHIPPHHLITANAIPATRAMMTGMVHAQHGPPRFGIALTPSL
jgi:hypothetical protein